MKTLAPIRRCDNNTAVGVQSVDRDLLNVSRVLQLPWSTKVRRIVVPSAMPYIFTGMRLSLGVGWMVLIAAEMLAQNPGLGKFVWDEFQNGSQESLSRIMVAVLAIAAIFVNRVEDSLTQNLDREDLMPTDTASPAKVPGVPRGQSSTR